MLRDGGTYRFIRDVQGSVRLVVDSATGLVAQRLDYDSFGNVLLDTNPGFQPFGFQSGLYDPDTALVQFGARWYDPATGRWLSKDPILLEGGLNLYVFCGNDPVNFADPLGLWGITFENISNFSAGFADVVSFGITRKVRDAFPDFYDQDYDSGSYSIGTTAGTVHSLALGGGRLAYAGAARAGSGVLLRQGATAANAAKAVAWRNSLKQWFNLGMLNQGRLMSFESAWNKYQSFGEIIRAAGRTATGYENALFGIRHSWNMLGAYFAGAGMSSLCGGK